MMKKSFAILLALVLCMALGVTALAEEATSALPQVGDTQNGFTVTDVDRYELVDADMITYVHDKTGATVLLIMNQDTNRLFDIAFRTPATNDTGLPHVFEHATTDGSVKYPSSSLFMSLTSQTYMTFMNAMTYSYGFTAYPIASLSEKQLLSTADYYVDSCFNPILMTDEGIFREEAWRYTMPSLDSDLAIEGTVYSEMLGSFNIERAHGLNATRTITPGSVLGNCTGGVPEFIPDMTWDDLKNFHEAYYHPSNSVTVLYGQFEDPGAFLSLLDGYFSAYDKKEFDFTDVDYTPITEAVTAEIPFATAAGSDPTNGSIATLSYRLSSDITDEEFSALDYLTYLLNIEGSPMDIRMKEQLPNAQFASYVSDVGPELLVNFECLYINREDAALFCQIVADSLADVAANGYNDALIDAGTYNLEISDLLTSESSSIGIDIVDSILSSWFMSEDQYGFNYNMDFLPEIAEYNENGAYASAIQKYIIENPYYALTVTYPEPGLKDTQDAALAEKLAGIKAAMTVEEQQAIVDATLARDQAETEDNSEYVAKLQSVTVDSLPEEVRTYQVTDETDEEGIRHIYVSAASEGLGVGYLLLDASSISQEDLLWYRLYATMMGSLDTQTRTRAELASQMGRYLYGYSMNTSIYKDDVTGIANPYLRVNFHGLTGELDIAYDLLYEMLFESKLDPAQIANEVTAQKSALKSSINGEAYAMAFNTAISRISDTTAYVVYTQYLPYYQFLCDVETMLAESPDEVVSHLSAIRTQLMNRYGAVTGYCGNEEGNEANTVAANAFLAKLDYTATTPVSYSFDAPAMHQATILDVNVNYNAIYASLSEAGVDEFTYDMAIFNSLVYDMYLQPLLRTKYGVYDFLTSADKSGVLYMTYMDPNIDETYQVYATLPELVSKLTIDQETLDGYILSSYSSLANSTGELSGAYSVLTDTVSHIPQERTLEYMRQLKSVSAESMASYSQMLANVLANGATYTVGSAAKVNASQQLFDVINNPFASVDTSAVVFSDVTDDNPDSDAIYAVFENMLMNAVSEDTFGVNDQITAGDIAQGMYVLIGGTSDQQEAIATMAEYGLSYEGDTVDTPMRRIDMVDLYYWFCSAVGADVTPPTTTVDAPDADQLDEDTVGEWAWMLGYGAIQPREDGTLAVREPATRQDLAHLLYVLFLEE